MLLKKIHGSATVIMLSCLLQSVWADDTGSASSIHPSDAKPINVALHLEPVAVQAKKSSRPVLSGGTLNEQDISALRGMTSDTTRLLEEVPGVSVYGAGAISGLPAIHGMADDRLRVQVDGMDLMSACPNHMNSVLSYINPLNVAQISVFAGITPVSMGGDSIGGSIQVKSLPPKFANENAPLLMEGKAGAFYRSNGHAQGQHMSATVASQQVSLSFSVSQLDAFNYKAAKNFKDPALWSGFLQNGAKLTDPDEVASSAVRDSINEAFGIAVRHDTHLLQFNLSQQRVGFEGFPNQRMDMTDNKNALYNLRYSGLFDWGELEARAYHQYVRHKMEMTLERAYALPAMPMDSLSTTNGGQIKASIGLGGSHWLRLGSEFQHYDLEDWWSPVGDFPGAMCCNDFLNIHNGKRDRLGIFGEVESNWNPHWLTLVGLRTDEVTADAGQVQGYSNFYRTDARLFNRQPHKQVDHNLDWTLLSRYMPSAGQSYEIGLAQKTRSPNLYERYPWSKFTMVALMNNFVGDGNAYIGNLDLEPEIAHTLSASADWHDAESRDWKLKMTSYLTYVDDYLDAIRCTALACGANNVSKKEAFVTLQYDNQSARLYGLDMSAFRVLGNASSWGSWTATGLFSYVRGDNMTTGGHLYHIMPANAKLALVHRLGGWTNTLETQLVAAKTRVSEVRNETETHGYGLLNLRTSYEFKHGRVDFAVENLLDKFYEHPLGGAYLGQGFSMSSGIIPWGVNVPGMGRSINVAVTLSY